MKSRILILFSCFLVLWSVLILRAVQVQVTPDHRLETLKRRQFETSLQIRTRRGAILDRNGNELAASVPAYSLFADPKLIKDPYGLAIRLGKTLDLPKQALRKRLIDKQRRFVWIKRQLSEAQRDLIRKWDVPGLGFIEEPKRVYPNGGLMAQVLGMVGSEGVGQEGLELAFNTDLQGSLRQVLLPRDARGRPLLKDGRSLTEVPDGADLELTVDYEAQFTLEQELQSAIERYSASSAVGVVLDAQTSEILAMANLPSMGFAETAREGGKRALELRRNRIVTDAFEPGSTMKTFVIAGALKEGLVLPSSRYNCEGGKMKVGDKWISEADAHHNFGWLTVTEILAQSSNVGVAKIAFDLGADRVYQTLADFGFGQKTGLKLPGEARGIVNALPWRPHLLSNISFGHGIAVTPIQLASAYAAIANGGILKRPVLVRAVKLNGETEPHTFAAEEIRRVLSPQDAATMRLMLSAATEEKATGANARIPGYPVAGKTGTAQKVDLEKGGYLQDRYISSFAGFVPAANPRYVIVVSIDDPQKVYYGSQVAAPVFARMAQYLVRRAGLPPVLITESNVIKGGGGAGAQARSQVQRQALQDLRKLNAAEESEDSKRFPNLLGMSLRDALEQVRDHATRLDVRGSGVVVRSIPAAGDPILGKRRVTLVLENPD